MKPKELCARNVCAALREAMNAALCAQADRGGEGTGAEDRQIDDLTADIISRAVECLERAQERLMSKPSGPEAKPPVPVPAKPEPAPMAAK